MVMEAELKDASHLAGRDTWETEEPIREERGFISAHFQDPVYFDAPGLLGEKIAEGAP